MSGGPYIAQPWDASDPVIKASAMQAAVEANSYDVLTLNNTAGGTATLVCADGVLELAGVALATTFDLTSRQPLDSDLTAIAALTTTAYGRNLLTLANQAALQAAVGATGGGTWGSITGTLSSQTDLQTALNNKLAASVTKAELNTAVSDGDVVYVGDGLNGTLGATTPASVAATTGSFSGALTLGTSGVLVGGTNTIEQYNSTNAQTQNLYGTRTDASNYRRLRISTTTAGVCTLTAEGLGTGATYGSTANSLQLAVASKVGYLHDGGSGWLYLQPNGAGSSGQLFVSGTTLRVQSDCVIYASSTTSVSDTPDSSISRSSAGVWRFGTTAANALGSVLLTNLTASGLIGLGAYTVATLPSASANAGRIAQVTDSSVTTNGTAVSAGGANRVMVFSNGTTWDVVVA